MSLMPHMSFNSFDPNDRSWLYITGVVVAVHCAFIGWAVLVDSPNAMPSPKAPSRLVVQTVELGPASRNPVKEPKSQSAAKITQIEEQEPELVAIEEPVKPVIEKKAEKEIALNANPLPPNPIKKNPMPATPITKNPLVPTPLERKTMAPPPKPEASKPVVPPTPAVTPTPTTPTTTKPVDKAPVKTPVKTVTPTKYTPPKNPLIEKRAAKLAEDKAAAAKKKQDADAATKKKEADAAAKKKQEADASKKKEAEQLAAKKIEAEQLAEQARQQKLLADAHERIAKIAGNRDKVTPSKSGSNTLAALPNAITSLQVDTLPVTKGGPPLSHREVTYRDELAGRLKLLLRLPEYGDVKVNLTLDRQGKVVKVAIVSAESSVNSKYIEKTLPGLSFPAFGTNFESAAEYAFSITLSNEI